MNTATAETMHAPITHFIAITPEDSPLFMRGPYTLESMNDAPAFAVFKGEAEDPGPVLWEIFDIDGCTIGDTENASEITGLIVTNSEPERDDEAECARDDQPNRRFTDEHAWLAFLRSGGTLCKVPDEEGSAYYRMLVVQT